MINLIATIVASVISFISVMVMVVTFRTNTEVKLYEIYQKLDKEYMHAIKVNKDEELARERLLEFYDYISKKYLDRTINRKNFDIMYRQAIRQAVRELPNDFIEGDCQYKYALQYVIKQSR